MFEIATLILLAGNICNDNKLALDLVKADTEVSYLEPGVCQAIERLAKQKRIHSSHMWYWESEENCQTNIVFMRNWYFEIDNLPSLDLIKLLPPTKYIAQQRILIWNASAFLEKLKTVAAPWELDNIQLLSEEVAELQLYWDDAYWIHYYKEQGSELWCRVKIRSLQNKFPSGAIEEIWLVPTFPIWRVELTR